LSPGSFEVFTQKFLETCLRESSAWVKRVTHRTEFYRVALGKKGNERPIRVIYTEEKHVTFKYFRLD